MGFCLAMVPIPLALQTQVAIPQFDASSVNKDLAEGESGATPQAPTNLCL